MVHWLLTKRTDELRIQIKRPTGRVFVEEVTISPKDEYGGQHTIHQLRTFSASGVELSCKQIHAYCGFDRGPLKTSTITRLLMDATIAGRMTATKEK